MTSSDYIELQKDFFRLCDLFSEYDVITQLRLVELISLRLALRTDLDPYTVADTLHKHIRHMIDMDMKMRVVQ